jgi:hypothetical protein
MTSSALTGPRLARPDLPKPNCRVVLVCGPPAAGKTSYVKANANASDIVIDVDMIAREHGHGLNPPAEIISELLRVRNKRLVSLASEPTERVAWVTLTAPSPSLRAWWCRMLGVKPEDLILLQPTRSELYRRIREDPEREHVRQQHYALVDKWLSRERADDSGIPQSGCDERGFPYDALHPWRRNA